MGNDRKEIIIDEIKHWKQSKLLPEKYCDFLLALYTYGEGVHGENKQTGSGWLNNALFSIDILFLILLLPISFLITHVLQVSIVLEIVLFISLLIIILIHFYHFKQHKKAYIHIPIIAFFLVFLISSISVFHHFIGQQGWISIVIFAHCLLWVIYGYKRQYYYLSASGIVGMILFIALIFI
ncbi:hypothetical protein [Alkalibacillus aidingensis]|uniref:hypothetical protein n=1 Tax=Alkalibacillus aidingensis TaxID=2747607 RepID=UPI001660F036|nr:hypothetical protein [Alkalibacillus aidingensis]